MPPGAIIFQNVIRFKSSLVRSFIKWNLGDNQIHDGAAHFFSTSMVVNSKTRPKSKQKKGQTNEEMQEIRRREIVVEKRLILERSILSSYLNVCIDSGQINRAFNMLLRYKAKSSKYFSSKNLLAVSHFNAVIRGWARLGSLEQVLETRLYMNNRNIKPNMETFTLTLLAIANQKKSDISHLATTLNDMKSHGLDLKKMFQPIYLSPFERERVKDLVRKIKHDFDDEFYALPIEYDCDLLQKLAAIESQPYYPNGDIDMKKINSWRKEQRSLEGRSSVAIKSIANLTVKKNRSSQASNQWSKYIASWRKIFLGVIEKDFRDMQNLYADDDRIHLYPYLCSIDKNFLVDLLINELEARAMSQRFSHQTNYLHNDLGRKVMTQYFRERAQIDGSHDELQKLYDDYSREYCLNPHMMGVLNSRLYIQKRATETKNYSIYTDRQRELSRWPRHVIVSVGKYLYSILLKETKFKPNFLKDHTEDPNTMTFAFYTAYIQIESTHRVKEEFRAHPNFTQFYLEGCRSTLKFDYSFLPSLVPPMPWISTDIGGYLTSTVDLVRQPELSQADIFGKTSINKLYPTLDSLNALSLCPWKVNERILDVAIGIFRAGGDENLEIPLDERKLGDGPSLPSDGLTTEERKLIKKERMRFRQRKREMYSLWCDCLYKLSIANHYRDRILWFPHNLDFRGRTYPVPPHFNHLGGDLARSLLLFGKGLPLGARGLDWLKIHLINLTGLKKRSSLDQRLEYANSIEAEIIDSAERPLNGNGWWRKSEEPWQTLACCLEIANALKSGDPMNYICHFPIHQDGSCNGLQHYAALGRDLQGGRSVNLLPLKSPQDVYSKVVEIVEKYRDEDAANGNKMALMLENRINRKLVKQTVMTIVYGVTRYGAREQVARQLKDVKEFPRDEIRPASSYVVSKVFLSIGTLFTSSQKIQEWLKLCAYVIGVHFNQPVRWSSPLGFPITQPYCKPYTIQARSATTESTTIETNVQTLYSDMSSKPNIAKQRSAFPPNYVHSLDSSHMMLTSLYCQRLGITFVSVHDCFWTHPSSVDKMNKVCREQFVALHSLPLLEELSKQFKSYYISSTQLSHNSRSDCIDSASSHKRLSKAYNSFRRLSDSVSDTEETLETEFNSPSMEKEKSVGPLIIFESIPETGELDLRQVIKSTYFFS